MSEVATKLAARKAMERQLDSLISAATKNVVKLKDSEMKENQIRNVVNVAVGSQSVEEVTNFIRYQIGRDTRRNTWGHNGFGKAVIDDIVKGQVKSAVDVVVGAVPDADPIYVRSELIALYLGYLNRCFIYVDKTKDWEGLSSAPGGGEGVPTNV
jgi:hypothetical protein